MALITFIISIIGLLWAANHLVTGASGIANHYHISPLILGLTLVAIGTSAPEITVAITSATEGRTELALGDAIGANIANIGLVLGLTILFRPLTIKSSLLQREYPLLFLVMLFTYALMSDGYFSVLDGCLLLLACIALMTYLVYFAQHAKPDALSREFKKTINVKRPMRANVLSLIMGIAVLPLSARYLVSSAIQTAQWLGFSDLVMGLTILALGTCLPNITTSMVAAYKDQDDLAIGNILGSNMYNLLLVLAFPALIHPATINRLILWRDIPVMFAITFVLLLISYKHKKIERWHGGVLLLIYCFYMGGLVFHAAS